MNKKEQTLVLLKPDSVVRGIAGNIIERFEKVGLKIVALKMLKPSPDLVKKHYTINENWLKEVGGKIKASFVKKNGYTQKTEEEFGTDLLKGLQKFMTAGPVVAIILEGNNSVKLTRKLVGDTEPLSSDVGTIRGDFVLDSYSLADIDNRAIRNAIHASSSVEDADKEKLVWFGDDEIIEYETAIDHILYDVNFDNNSD